MCLMFSNEGPTNNYGRHLIMSQMWEKINKGEGGGGEGKAPLRGSFKLC